MEDDFERETFGFTFKIIPLLSNAQIWGVRNKIGRTARTRVNIGFKHNNDSPIKFERMEIKEEDFHVWYDQQTQTVTCLGALRLAGMDEYAPIIKLLDDAIQQKPSTLKLDLTQLSFLNSSGINAISKFVLKLRQHPETQLTIQGSNEIFWQSRSLPNLKRLMPNLDLQLV